MQKTRIKKASCGDKVKLSPLSKSSNHPSQEIVSLNRFDANRSTPNDLANDRLQNYHEFLKNRRKSHEKLIEAELPDSGGFEFPGKEDWGLFTTGDDYRKVKFSKRTIQLKPEAYLFFTQVEGVAKNLLLYLIVMLEEGTLEFEWHKTDADYFKELSKELGGKEPSDSSIEKALKELKKLNALRSVGTCRYILSPLLVVPARTDFESNLLSFIINGIFKISKSLGESREFIRKHLLPKEKTPRKRTREETLTPENNQVAC